MSPIRKLCFYLIVIVMLCWALVPFIYTLMISLSGFYLPTKLGLPTEITLNNYIEVFGDEEVWRCTLNSTIIAVIATMISIGVSIPSSYVFSRDRFRTSTSLFVMFLIFRLIPWVSLTLPIFLLMVSLGLVDTHLGVSIAHACWIVPTAIWFMKGFFDTVPVTFEESAKIDGASTFQTLKDVILPIVTPGIIAVTLYAFFTSFVEYVYSLVLTRVNAVTLPILMAGYLSEFQVLWRKISAISIISCIPLIILYTAMLKFMGGDIWGTAVKG